MQYPLVSTAWLEANLFDSNVVVLDASMASVIGKEPIVYPQFTAIPRAEKFDLETVFVDKNSSQIHAMPTPEQFMQGIAHLGLNSDSQVVIYDDQGIYSSPRAWWMFKLMGFDRVFVLDGGLPQWLSEERMTVDEYQSLDFVPQGDFVADYQANLICDLPHVLARFDAESVQVFDARGEARFCGQAPEPRENMRSGHIPGSINVPFAQVLDGYKIKDVETLQALFESPGEDIRERIFSCGSGITACILILAAVAAGHQNTVLYDGSWADWGSNPQVPISCC
ncbi:sulfurtransferase [Shewanella sp. Isolate11]|uniref:sulfurtransferase n=1 Tax=Shewanella sp. Isolate11 TaxID=2908530 RepID=UPI001EFCCBCE|nr:sulfurtransferase [Shewanella sp. Isolate11]MCG9695871.1 sulfurtransferase [Shewanella sp. Isolate11]